MPTRGAYYTYSINTAPTSAQLSGLNVVLEQLDFASGRAAFEAFHVRAYMLDVVQFIVSRPHRLIQSP